MFDDHGKLTLELGTSKRISTTNVLKERNKAVFLTKPPFKNKNPLLDNFTILEFLSTLSDSNFHFSQKKKKNQKSQLLVRYIHI